MKFSTRAIAILSMLLPAVSVYSQHVIKKHNGNLHNGKVTYAYYEDTKTGDEVRNGAFKYTELVKSNGSIYSANFSGNYKDGFKDGIWNYTITHKDILLDGGYYQTGTTTMVQSFKNGMPNGRWSYFENFKIRNKKHTQNGWFWGAFEAQKPLTVTLNYQNGSIAGEFRLNNDIERVVGNFNNTGFMTGKWQIIKKDYSQIDLTAQDGIITYYSDKDTRTGKVSYKSMYDAELQQVQKDALKLSKEMLSKLCENNGIKVDTMPSSNLFHFEEYFKQHIFMYSEIFGDKTYQDFNDTKNYGHYILIERPSKN